MRMNSPEYLTQNTMILDLVITSCLKRLVIDSSCNVSTQVQTLNDLSPSVDIDGYSFVHKSRENRSGGGVGLYVSSNLNFKFRCDFDFSEPNVAESLFIEILKPQGRNIVAGVIYRPPNQNVDEFLTMTNEILSKISKENEICYLMSDSNLNLMNHQSHSVIG